MKNMHRWDMDSPAPGEPTSSDILSQWLLAPGNYQFWQRNHHAAAGQILDELVAHGITHRTHGSVTLRIHRMKQHFEDATAWLQETGALEQYRQGNDSPSLKAELRRRCPRYRELSAVFTAAVNSTEKKRSAATKARPSHQDTNPAGNARPSTQDTTPKKAQGTSKRTGKRSSSAAEGTQTATPQKKPKPANVEPSSVDHASAQEAIGHGASWEDGEAPWYDSSDAERGSFLNADSGKQQVNDRLVDFEIERRQAIAKCHLEGEQKREDVRTNCEMLLARYKLLAMGVPKETVDSAFPLRNP